MVGGGSSGGVVELGAVGWYFLREVVEGLLESMPKSRGTWGILARIKRSFLELHFNICILNNSHSPHQAT